MTEISHVLGVMGENVREIKIMKKGPTVSYR